MGVLGAVLWLWVAMKGVGDACLGLFVRDNIFYNILSRIRIIPASGENAEKIVFISYRNDMNN